MSEYARIYTRRSRARSVSAYNAEPRQEYTAIISSIPNTYTDENGQEQPIDNTLVIAGEDGIPAYENAANDLQFELPAAFAPGDGLTVTLGDASLRLVPLAGDFTHPAALEKLGVLTSTCSVVCQFPQAYFNKFSVAALEAPLFHPLLCLAAQRKGMVIIMNDVVCISRSKEKEILSLIKQDGDTFCVIINGKNICTLSDYLKVMSEEFSFPRPTSKNVDVYLDWMRDLDWIEQEKIVLFIENFSHFLKNVPCEKIKMIELFKKYIFPWWDGEVEYHVVEGKRRSFMVYLVD